MTRSNLTFASVFLTLTISALTATGQTTSFTYQGRLTDAGAPANGAHSMTFALFAAQTGGTPVATITDSVTVTNGLFTAVLDFGSAPFDGSPRWVEATVGTTILSPRQQVTSAPYSIRSFNAANLGGVPANSYLQANGDGSALTNLNGNNIADGTISPSKIGGGTVLFNPQRLALLKWYAANRSFPSISVNSPRAMAFDGTFVYVAGQGELPYSVARIRAATGVEEAPSVTVGDSPDALAFDGTYMYVANRGSNNVMRIRASDATLFGSPIAVGTGPMGLGFDGTFMYVANSVSNNVTRIRASSGLVEGAPIAVGTNPQAIAFDGTFVYVANFGSGDVTRIRASTGVVEGGPIATGTNPRALAFDGTFMYVANQGSNSVSRIRSSTGLIEGSAITVGSLPTALVFDGAFIYVANRTSNTVMRIRAGTQTVEGTPIPTDNRPVALAFDGVHVYVGNQGFHTVKRF